ncbi:hypothetical protein [Brunnivagina elsteri]|uniref:Uncharacterized protein n=1 Tax=Brunnivagina elsteri CCALA 953 TaxID=987040 RepID=A0A2A2TGJ0_9CYAN|nr:hypothetical protein [Calothrix elsteri]PAX52860.1 hypothetical protein CK510_17025 [Calothrix elsteri CCALA 953]
MHETTKKRTIEWTEKHESFCLKKGIIGSAERLWYWLIQHNPIGEEIEPDLTDFNQWVNKNRGKGYCPRQLKNAFNKLIECGVIAPIKRFNWHCFKLRLLPLNPVRNTEKKQSEFVHESSKISPERREELRKSAHRFYQQQKDLDIIKRCVSNETRETIRAICREIGINLTNDKCEIFYFPVAEIKACVAIYKKRILKSPKILRGLATVFDLCTNPVGWLVSALRDCYHLEDVNIRLLSNDKDFDFNEFFYEVLNGEEKTLIPIAR